jgi:hypothetical protein
MDVSMNLRIHPRRILIVAVVLVCAVCALLAGPARGAQPRGRDTHEYRHALRPRQEGRDVIASGFGDETGYHLYVASRRHEWFWRAIATIDPGGATDEPWVGYQCMTTDGRFAVVVTAPRSAANSPSEREHGAFAYSVDVTTGHVLPLADHVALMYFNPSCGAGHAVALSRYLGGEEQRTSVLIFDASTGKQTWSKTYVGEVTSAVPTEAGVVGAIGSRIVALNTQGLRKISEVAGRPFEIRASDSGVQFLVARGRRSFVETLKNNVVHREGSGPLLSTDLYQGSGGRNVLVTSSPRPHRGFRVAATPNQGGDLVATSLSGDAVLSDTARKAPARRSLRLELGRGEPIARRMLTDSQGQLLRRTLPRRARVDVYTGIAEDRSEKTGFARASTNTTTPACSVPRLDLNRQVMQPNSAQVNWAIQQATRGLLKGSVLTRPENFAHMGLVPYSPSSDFAPIALSGGGVVPPSVIDAVFAQESNWYQASFHSLPGVPGDPLVADYYGANGGINEINYEDSDCGYGIGQVTTGMTAAATSPYSEHGKWKIAVDYAENIAASNQILAEKWNTLAAAGVTLNNGSAAYLENWYFAIWAYNTGFHPNSGSGPWGLGWTNNPQNASYPPNRKPFLRTTYADAAHPADWPYQERVIGFMETPLFNYRGERSYARPSSVVGGQIQIPAFSTFCNASDNCSSSYHNPSNPELDYCELASRECWWHSHVSYVSCPGGCATSVFTVSETATEPPNDPNYIPDCQSVLPAGTIVVDDESSDINLRGCSPSNWSNHGTFSVEYGKDGSNVPIGVIDWHQLGVGFGGHDYFTHNRNPGDTAHIDTGTWTPGKIRSGLYAIQAHIPDNGATTEAATYTIYRGDGTSASNTINQHVGGNQWVPLGDYELNESGAKVALANVNGEASGTKDVAYDAISFTFLANPKTSAQEEAAKFEPVLSFDSSEKWRPLNLTSFFGETNGSGEPAQHKCIPFRSPDAATILGEGQSEGFKEEPGDFYVLEPAGESTFKVDVARCVPVSTVAQATSWRSRDAYIDIGPLGHSDEVSSYRSPHPGCVHGVLLDCNGDEVPNDPYSAIYYTVTDTSGHPFIEYWYFYRYNSFSDSILVEHSHHEGDWEATAIAPSPDGSHFEYVSFSQHGEWFNYVRNVLHCAGEAEESCGTQSAPKGRRVVDYVANGDQSNYPTPCIETEGFPPFSSCPRGAGGPIGDRGHDGADAWGHDFDGEGLLPMPAIGSGNWTEWPGHWGATPEETSSPWLEPGQASPQSPAAQAMFAKPWGNCGHDIEPNPCALPSSTGIGSAVRAGTIERLSGQCKTWFGAEVEALACDGDQLQRTVAQREFGHVAAMSLSVRRAQPRRAFAATATGSAPGLVQAVGAPLSAGDEITLRGPVDRGTIVAVRIARRKHLLTRFVRPVSGPSVREHWRVLKSGRLAKADHGSGPQA